MTTGRWTATILLLSVAVAALLWPAIWNGFPVVFPDTGGYLARPFDGTLEMGRSALYGAFLAAGVPLQFWPNVIAQAALTVWMLAITVRVHGIAARPLSIAGAALALSLLTGLPWYVSQLMPDILAPCAVLALYLLAFRRAALAQWETFALVAVVAVAIACHMSILALGLSLAACLAVWRIAVRGRDAPRPALLAPAMALAIGIVLAPLSNLALTGKLAFTPGGVNFIFGRLVQDGIVRDYLNARCPDERLRLCDHRDQIAGLTADEWLWDEPSPFHELGGIDGFGAEAKRIVVESLWQLPVRHVVTAAAAALSQFMQAETGEGLTSWNPHTAWIFSLHAPEALSSYETSRQAQQQWDFDAFNALHVPLAFASLGAIPILLLLRRRLGLTKASAGLLAFLALALVFNAAICGVLSNPHDRYQARLIWLLPLGLGIAAFSRAPQLRLR